MLLHHSIFYPMMCGPRAAVAGESHQGSRKDSQEERETERIGKHTISSRLGTEH